jgi:hypothetical protein
VKTGHQYAECSFKVLGFIAANYTPKIANRLGEYVWMAKPVQIELDGCQLFGSLPSTVDG